MTFEQFRATVETRRKRLTVYSSDDPDVEAYFDGRNVAVETRSLPGDVDGFVVVHDHEGFVGAIAIETLRELLEPPVPRPWDPAILSEGYRTLFEILENSVFVSLDRGQLLSASREIENRAWRVGRGTLLVGFQRPAAFEKQRPIYDALVDDTALEVHVYVRDDSTVPERSDVAVHLEDDGEVGDYWFLAFDGDGDDDQKCALLAEERSPGEYDGFWTYDPELVDDLSAYVRRTYG